MFRYSAYTLNIESELELQGLPVSTGEPDVRIRFAPDLGRPRLSTAQEEFASSDEVANFVVRDGREILISPVDGASSDALRVMLLGKIMAFLLRQRGWLPLHASVVAIGGEAAMFLGSSGMGKSTAAAAFHRRGHVVIADDVGAVDRLDSGCVVLPAWPRLRLTAETQAHFDGMQGAVSDFEFDKYSVSLGQAAFAAPVPVKRIYVLEDGNSPLIEQIPTVLSAVLLETHTFVKRWRVNHEILEFHFRKCIAVAGAMNLYRLARPRCYDALPALVDLVEEDMTADG